MQALEIMLNIIKNKEDYDIKQIKCVPLPLVLKCQMEEGMDIFHGKI